MKTMQHPTKTHRQYRFKAAVFAMLSAVLLLPPSTVFAADLSNKSTNPPDVRAANQDGAVSHLIKKETVAMVDTLKLRAYYPNNTYTRQNQGNGKFLTINYGAAGMACLIQDLPNGPGDKPFNPNFGNVKVIIGEETNENPNSSDQNTARYNVPMSNVCNERKNPHRNNLKAGRPNENKNIFFAKYRFPGRLQYDDKINKYFVNITIKYGNGVQVGENSENSVNFVTQVTGAAARLGTLGKSSSNQFGVRSAFVRDDSKEYAGVQVATRFGVPCTENNRWRAVKLYDVDAGVFGDTFIWVSEERANGSLRKLERNEYTTPGEPGVPNSINLRASWRSGSKMWQAFGGSDQDSQVLIKNPKKNTRYRFHVFNRHTGGYRTPRQNVLSIGTPFDSIYSEITCDDADLEPFARMPPTAERGEQIEAIGGVTNNSDDPAFNHDWRITRVRYSPGQDGITGSIGPTNDPFQGCSAGYIGANQDCTVATNTNAPNFNAQQTKERNYAISVDHPVGTRYCTVTSVRGPNPSQANKWVHAYRCTLVGKEPKLQVWGYDAAVGGIINTSTSALSSGIHGSWGEYGLASDGLNYNMASGSGLNQGSSSPAQVDWSKLTFANRLPSSTEFGLFGGARALVPPTHTSNIINVGSGGFYRWSSPELRQCREADQSYSCVVDGTILIDPNGQLANFNNSAKTVADLQRRVVVADNIVIDPDVTKIDAWLYAVGDSSTNNGYISTCSEVRNDAADTASSYLVPLGSREILRADMCDKQLRFNGTVVAHQLYAYRTAGSGGEAAEIFNLRADAFLSSFGANGGGKPVATTDTITELPPRF